MLEDEPTGQRCREMAEMVTKLLLLQNQKNF